MHLVTPGQGATLEHLLARVLDAPLSITRCLAASQIRRLYAYDCEPKTRTNLATDRGRFTESDCLTVLDCVDVPVPESVQPFSTPQPPRGSGLHDVIGSRAAPMLWEEQ